MNMPEGQKCGCFCHKVKGLMVTLIGLSFLLGAFGVLSENLVSILWPIFVLIAGLRMLFSGMCKCCKDS